MARTITSANSAFYLTVPGVVSSPTKLEGFGTDQAFSTEGYEGVEVRIGVDGKMSAGFTPALFSMSVTLQADSLSNDLFDYWVAAVLQGREVIFANGVVQIPSIQKKYTLVQGILRSWPPISEAKKVLEPRTFGLTWQNISPAPM